jgi:hypothetical protein
MWSYMYNTPIHEIGWINLWHVCKQILSDLYKLGKSFKTTIKSK